MKKDNTEKIERGNTGLAVKAGFWYVLSTFLSKAISFITTPIFSRLMNKEAYGEFTNYASWEATLIIIVGAELYNTVARAYYDFKEDFDCYVSSIGALGCVITAVLYAVFLFFKPYVLKVVAIPEEFIHILFFGLFCQSLKQVFMARERTLYRYKRVAVISIIGLAVPTLLAVILVSLAGKESSLSARIYGYYVPSSLVGLACGVWLFARGRGIKLSYWKYGLALGLPLLVHYLMAYFLTSSNNIVTKIVLGAESTADLSIASSTIHILTALFHAVSGAVTTWFMDNLNQNRHARLKKEALVYIGFIAAVSIMVILAAPEVVLILGGSRYTASVELVPGMILYTMIQSTISVFTIILTYDKNVVKTAVFNGVVAALNIGAKVWLLPIFGITCLPYINIVSYAALFVINYLLVRQCGFADTINLPGYAALIGVVAVFMIISQFLYAHSIIRYVLIVVFAAALCTVLWKYRATIMGFLRKKKAKPEKKD